MKLTVWLLVAALAVVIAAPVAAAAEEDTMDSSGYVVMPHMKGSLALQVSSISGAWYVPASEAKAAQLRLSSPVLGEAKTLSGADADATWAVLRARGAFLFVAHMGGTLAIPRAQVRTAYYAEDAGTPRLRLVYDGDPNGKTLDGDEAVAVWAELTR